MRHPTYEDMMARDAYDAHYERLKEMLAGDPDVTEAELRQAALNFADTYSGSTANPKPPTT